MAKLDTLSRRTVRYWCFRFQNEAAGGAPAKGAPSGLRARFEKMEWFGGWAAFGVSWDVANDDPWRIVPRTESIHQEWDRQRASALAQRGDAAVVMQRGASTDAASAKAVREAKSKQAAIDAEANTVIRPSMTVISGGVADGD